MKKTLCLFLATIMMLGMLAGCGTQQTVPAATEAPSEESATQAVTEDYGTIPANISIGTNPSGQAAYTQGAGIADVINKANIGTTVTVEETNGFPVNIQLMMAGDIEFGYVNNYMLQQAYNATGAYSEYEAGKILAVMNLAPTEMHVIVPADSDVESIYDLAGKRVGVGQPGGIALEVTTIFLEALGYGESDFERVEVNLANQCEYLQDNQLDVVIWIGSAPLAAITSLFATKEVKLLNIDEEAITKVQALLPEAEAQTIPANTYNNQTDDINTFGLRMGLAARADVSNETVYQFVKLIMENVDTLKTVHPALGNISAETVTLGMTENTPLHPGAQRYYQEIGVQGLDKISG